MKEMEDATPSTGILYALRRNGMTMKAILAELIDNALDANARRITVVFRGGGTGGERAADARKQPT